MRLVTIADREADIFEFLAEADELEAEYVILQRRIGDCRARIGYSCVRPGIESWHKILKSGCSVEDCQLEEAERLKPYLTLMGITAWRLFWLTHINRQTPSAPCTAILAEHEWKALYTPPTIAHRPFQRSRTPYVKPCAGSHSLAGF